MWLWYALGSAVLSGSTAILAKYGAKKVDSSVAVALRSTVILAFAWLIVLTGDGWRDIGRVSGKTLILPLLSGASSAFAWLCYFRALRSGKIGQVAPIDKASIILTMLGGSIFLGEPMSVKKAISIVLVGIGALLMYERTSSNDLTSEIVHKVRFKHSWLIWALASTVFTALTTLLSKAGTRHLDSDLGFAIRTGVMFVITWSMVFIGHKADDIKQINRNSMLFVGLSGLSTALAWFCYFRALASPSAEAGIVQPTDKLSILVSMAGAKLLFKEKLSSRSFAGLCLLTAGILVLIVF